MSSQFHATRGATELDPELLGAPFQVQTNWHVITGAPCCGKTTIINQFADLGYRTVHETARMYLEGEMAKGRTVEEILDSEEDYLKMADLHLHVVDDLPPAELAFLDRGFPDVLAFFRHKKLDLKQILVHCYCHRYASVFMLDRLPLELDGCRLDDDHMDDLLAEWHTRDYTALGYTVIHVPVLPVAERLAFILSVLCEQGHLHHPSTTSQDY